MCGILGYYNIQQQPVGRSRAEVEFLRDLMRLRGPDDAGYLAASDQSWMLAHRRLSILDLSAAGHQPMSDDGGKIHVCYNGEIYNFRELRKDLERAGYAFRSHSDTEVLMNLYKAHGTDCFQKLEGMFAVIVVDEDRRRAVIARDPVGKKPIYYALIGGNVVVASDPGVISRDKHYQKAVDIDGLYSLLTMGGVKSPDTLFAGIRKLEPGTFRVIDDDFRMDAPATSFFDFDLVPRSELNSGEEAVDRLDHLLDRAVEKRMISDVPFGVFLSGGIDSALILAYMSQHTDRVNTFSIDMQRSADAKKETNIASQLAEQFKTNHHTVHINDNEYVEILDKVLLANSTMAIPDSVLLAKLSQLARDHGVYVIETGEGADELFLGYSGYLSALNLSYEKLKRTPRVPRLVARAACLFGSDARKNRASYLADAFDIRSRGGMLSDFLYDPFFSYQAERIVSRRYHHRVRHHKFEMLNDSITARLPNPDQYAPSTLSFLWSCAYRWGDFLLNRIDNFTMTSSVEGRAPFLDIDVINYGLSLSDRLKVNNGSPKYILRKIAQKRVSSTHSQLPKRGFGGGNDNMLNDKVCDYMKDKLERSPSYRDTPLFDVEGIASQSQLFTLTSFHSWVDTWM